MGCGFSSVEASSSGYPKQGGDSRNAGYGQYGNGGQVIPPPRIPVPHPQYPERDESGEYHPEYVAEQQTDPPEPVATVEPSPEPQQCEDDPEPDVPGDDPEPALPAGDAEPRQSVEPPKPEVPAGGGSNANRRRTIPLGGRQLPLHVDDRQAVDIVAVDENATQRRMGRSTVTIDTRQRREDGGRRQRPAVEAGQLWEDPDFGEEIAFAGLKDRVFYMRPKEMCKKPALFTDGTTRFDIEQGSVGTCYLLSVIASLADKKDILDQIFVPGEYDPESATYDGVLRVRFWNLGEWVDVYIDDRLPVSPSGGTNRIWSAQSHDPDELWVTLLEKAYTKEFGGNYRDVSGGLPTLAFTNLTGGITEYFNLETDLENVDVSDFFSRVTNALKCGSLVTSSSKEEKDGVKGIVGNHAYTLTGSGIVNANGRHVQLFRIRNPWGSNEWNGSWSDKSKEWQAISPEVRRALSVNRKEDGEFWINMDDFFEYFCTTSICNFTPDFDGDGKAEDLDDVCNFHAEWRGETAAGSDEKKFNNPKFEFVVPDGGGDAGTIQVVIQFMHKSDDIFVRLELYSVEVTLPNEVTVYDELTNNAKFSNSWQLCYRYNLKPGRYVMLATTYDEGAEEQFLIRTFSAIPLTCREVKAIPKLAVRESDLEFEYEDTTYKTPKIEYIPGSWNERNAGGQIACDTFYTNPQYLLTLSGSDPVPLTVLLMKVGGGTMCLGFKLWQRTDEALPLDGECLYSIYDSALRTTDGEAIFIDGAEAEGTYLLAPGQYTLLLFTNDSGDHREFVLGLATAEGCHVTREDYNQ